MRARWREFELPTRIEVDQPTMTPTYGRFVAEPFERGFGTTVGNSLRRVLLSSIEGGAVTWLKIEGVQHEFSSIPGVVEDVTDVVLNVKELLVRVNSEQPKTLEIDVEKEGEVTGHDITCDPSVEIINPDHVLCTISEKRHLKMTMGCRRGRGYVTAEEHIAREGDFEIGVIPVDSIFSPVRRVRYRTENTRVGQLTDYDRLLLEIWTDGTVAPDMALVEASKILRKHLNPFVFYHELGREMEQVETPAEAEKPADEKAADLKEKLLKPIEDLDLSVRAANCLEAEHIKTIGDLVRKTEDDLLKVRNFGKTSLREIKKKIEGLGLELGTDVDAALGAS